MLTIGAIGLGMAGLCYVLITEPRAAARNTEAERNNKVNTNAEGNGNPIETDYSIQTALSSSAPITTATATATSDTAPDYTNKGIESKEKFCSYLF